MLPFLSYFFKAGKANKLVERKSKGGYLFVELIRKRLAKELTSQLYTHCDGVAETAARLAVQLGCDTEKATLAGLLHDCAREWSPEKLLRYAAENDIEVDILLESNPMLLHGPVGAHLAQSMGVSDDDILSAVRCHTLGCPGMSLLAQIIYVADKIEPGRFYPGIKDLRNAVARNFNEGLIQCASKSIFYVVQNKQAIHPLTITFYNWLVRKTGE